MRIEPYLFFDGRCEEAIAFYTKHLGAKHEALIRFSESPEPGNVPPGSEHKIMHAVFRIGDATIMASDGKCQGSPSFKGFSLTLNAVNEAEAESLFKALSAGGQVQMPLAKTFFASRFGMVVDRFGVSWMVLAAPQTVATT
jgi:PhnB protein